LNKYMAEQSTHSVFEDMTHGGTVKKLAKQFGGIAHPDHENKFAIPHAKVDAFHAAASKAGSFLKHKSPTGLYHYRSAGSIGASGRLQFTEAILDYGHISEDRARQIVAERYGN
jgi:hypothetical protein